MTSQALPWSAPHSAQDFFEARFPGVPAGGAKVRGEEGLLLELPYERSMRVVDDILAVLGKDAEGEREGRQLRAVQRSCVSEYGVTSGRLCQVSPGYYDRPLESRMAELHAPSVECLCKSLLLENTHTAGAPEYWLVVVQYVSTLNSQRLFKFVKEYKGVSKSELKLRMVSSAEEAERISGFEHNAITPFGMRVSNIPVIVSSAIVGMRWDWLWLGGGAIDLKLGCSVKEFVRCTKALVADITDRTC